MTGKLKKTIGVGAAVLAIVFFVGYNCVFLPQDRAGVGFGKTDFAVFYVAGACFTGAYDLQPIDIFDKMRLKEVIEQVRKFNGGSKYLYPPQSALMLAPFSWFKLNTAARLWSFISAALYISTFYLCIHFLIKDNVFRYRYSVVLAALAISPITYGLFKTGQLNSLIWFLMISGLILMSKKKDVWAGVCLAVATTFKIFPIIFLPYFIFKKRWKSVASLLIGVLMLFLVALPFLGWGNMIEVFSTVQKEVVTGDLGYIAHSTSLFGSFRMAVQNGTFDFVFPNSETPRIDVVNVIKVILQVLTVIFGFVVMFVLYINRKSKQQHDLVVNYSMLVLYILLFSMSIHNQFHIWTLPIILYLLSYSFTTKNIPVHVIGIFTLITTQFLKLLPLPDGFTFIGFKISTFSFLLLFLIILATKFKWLTWLDRPKE